MACYHPVEVAVKRKALYGRARVRDKQKVPCGTCAGCRAEQARQWSVRIMHECQIRDHAWFLTLTYRDEEIPQYGSLYPEDLREFFKAVRRDYPAGQVRYYACGEYGDRTQRPHYHAVLFGVDFLDRVVLRNDGGSTVWRSSTLERYWPHGLSEFGSVTPASAAYVAGYVRKKVTKKMDPDAYERVDADTGELVQVEPEFSRMSLKPAIGRKWLEKYWQDVYPRDFVVVDGYEAKPPRYYDKVMDDHCDLSLGPCFAGACVVHQEVMMKVREKRIKEAVDLSDYTLMAQEKIHEAQLGLFKQRTTF